MQRANARCGGLQLLASPWSPPAWMKTNGCMLRGGRLRSECRAAWTCYIDRYLTEMEHRGLPIRFLTVQNPDGSLACVLLNDSDTPRSLQIVCGETSTHVIRMEPYSLASYVFR